jgi:hypothetical protein
VDGVAQASERLSLYLPYAFACYTELLANLFEGIRLAIDKLVSELKDTHFSWRQAAQDFLNGFMEYVVGDSIGGQHSFLPSGGRRSDQAVNTGETSNVRQWRV